MLRNLIQMMHFLVFVLPVVFSASTGAQTKGLVQANSLLWSPGDHQDWYEWWYYKVRDPKTNEDFYFCYGLVNPGGAMDDQKPSFAYVNAGRFSDHRLIEQKWTAKEFHQDKMNHRFTIGGANALGLDSIQGDILNSQGQRVRWNLQLTSDWSFDAMGWARHVPELFNIYWYPLQASVLMTGWIEFDGQRHEVTGTQGYHDRNWGRGFPKWWAWIASNEFAGSPGTVLASGGGRPRLLNVASPLEGYTLGLRHKGREYVFRPTDGDSLKMDIHFGQWHIEATNLRNQKVVLNAFAAKSDFLIIPFVSPQGPVFKDYEALHGHSTVEIYTRPGPFDPWVLVDRLQSEHTGIEYGSFDDQEFHQMFRSGFVLH